MKSKEKRVMLILFFTFIVLGFSFYLWLYLNNQSSAPKETKSTDQIGVDKPLTRQEFDILIPSLTAKPKTSSSSSLTLQPSALNVAETKKVIQPISATDNKSPTSTNTTNLEMEELIESLSASSI